MQVEKNTVLNKEVKYSAQQCIVVNYSAKFVLLVLDNADYRGR